MKSAMTIDVTHTYIQQNEYPFKRKKGEARGEWHIKF